MYSCFQSLKSKLLYSQESRRRFNFRNSQLALRHGDYQFACLSAREPQMCSCYIGIDFGTSGARAIAINSAGEQVADARENYRAGPVEDLANEWLRVLFQLISDIPSEVRSRTARLSLDGTSSTALLVDKQTGEALTAPKMYNEPQDTAALIAVKDIAPPRHTTTASTSTLCKLMAWHQQGRWQQLRSLGHDPILQHQADWLLGQLCGQYSTTDYNNCLKLGYDVDSLAYPHWMENQDWSHLLPPRVLAPGEVMGVVTKEVAAECGLPPDCAICTGTTDSIAAFLAAGASCVGEAVTSLGSTLAIKLMSDQRVDDADYGVYSHRMGELWLVGGASNSGGAVLRQYFTDDQLQVLTESMDVNTHTGLDYYPLPKVGERFPVNDPNMTPRLQPRPPQDAVFLQAILEGISRIEKQSFDLLTSMGASPVTKVFTAGGGAKNVKWMAMRQQLLGVTVVPSPRSEAAYGAALLAQKGTSSLVPTS